MYKITSLNFQTTRETLNSALAYATMCKDTGSTANIFDADGNEVRYSFNSSGRAVIVSKACDECGEVARWRDHRWWAFCELCCAERGL